MGLFRQVLSKGMSLARGVRDLLWFLLLPDGWTCMGRRLPNSTQRGARGEPDMRGGKCCNML
jgi:hypothetical protein